MFKKKQKRILIESDFSFLIECGFSMEKFIGREIEYVYRRNNLTICASHYSGVLESYRKTMCFNMSITVDDKGKNLLDCTDIFGYDLIHSLLKRLINMNHIEQIAIYAQFLKDNIDKLLSVC